MHLNVLPRKPGVFQAGILQSGSMDCFVSDRRSRGVGCRLFTVSYNRLCLLEVAATLQCLLLMATVSHEICMRYQK